MAPIIGTIIERVGIRSLMIAGAIQSAVGFALIPQFTGTFAMLAIYGLLIGPGTALMGTVPSLTLVNNWFARGQGRMMGVVMMPVILTAVPLAVVALKPHLGLFGMLYAVAGLYLLALPLFLAIVDRPEKIGMIPVGAIAPVSAPGEASSCAISAAALWRNPAFLLIVLAAGLIVGAGVCKSAHFVPILTEEGWDLSSAALLLSISGATGIIGSLLFGQLADRYTASGALAINAMLQALVWLVLVLPSPFSLLVVDALVIGACGGAWSAPKAFSSIECSAGRILPA